MNSIEILAGLIFTTIAIGAIILGLISWHNYDPKSKTYQQSEVSNPNTETDNKENYTNAYKAEYLMTRNEKTQYWLLRSWADANNLIVFTKVRLADLISPRENSNNRQKLFWKIQAKHVDFVICDNSIRVKCIIEIMDNSHYDPERIKRDNFVREVLTSCGYKLIQTHHIDHDVLTKVITPEKITTNKETAAL